ALDILAALDLLWLTAVGVDGWRSVNPRRLRVARDTPPSFSLGREGQVVYEWRNPEERAAALIVRETRPEVIGGVQPPRALVVPPEGREGKTQAREALPVLPARRGRGGGQDAWLAIRSLGPWGLAWRQSRLELPWPVTVFPNLPVTRVKSSLGYPMRRRELGFRPMRRLGEGRLFESLREWVPGDDTRTIDWKATARRQKLIARQYEEERRQQVMLVIDAGRLLTADLSGAPRLEHVVRAAASLAYAAHHHDDNVGVMAFADDVLQYVAPQRGRRGLRQVLDVLATVEPRLVEPDYPGAFRYLAVRNRKRALTVLFTDVIDRLASEALVANAASLRPRHLPLVVTLRHPELDLVATGRPDATAGGYRKAAAEELLAAREEALGQMRRAGVLVLDVTPVLAAQAVVDQYLELKRRGRL
ncbi:MAG: DUF58 domain-containing protein, partial [Gemmatimonadales bacterium]